MTETKKRCGFTLIEILVIMGILAVLLSVVMVRLKPMQRKNEALDIMRQSDVRSIQQAATQYAIDNLALPPGAVPGTWRDICHQTLTGSSCTGGSVNGIDLSVLVPEYLAGIPIDPAQSGSSITGYKLCSDGDDLYVYSPALGSPPPCSITAVAGASSAAGGGGGTLVAHWKFDDNTGTSAIDSSGNNHAGSILNGATWTTGILNSGLQFDGSNDEVSIADNAALDGFSSFSLSVWIQPYSWKDAQIAGVSGSYDVRMRSDGRIQYSVTPALGNTISQSVAPLNHWTHLSLVFDGAAVRLYVNGVLDTSTNATGTVAVTSVPFRIGAPSFFHGKIDDVRLHNAALTATEAGALAAAGFAGSQVAYWKFDDGSGASATDSSGNNHTATLLNGPAWTSSATAPTTYSNSHSLRFDGTDDYARVSYNAGIDFRTRNGFTASTWVYMTSFPPSNGAGFMGMTANGWQGWEFFVQSNYIRFLMNGSNEALAHFSPSPGWMHTAAVWDGQNMKVYINGALIATRAYAAAPANGNNDLIIGAMYSNGADTGGTPGYRYNEKLDDMRLFNRPLSLAEVRALSQGSTLP